MPVGAPGGGDGGVDGGGGSGGGLGGGGLGGLSTPMHTARRFWLHVRERHAPRSPAGARLGSFVWIAMQDVWLSRLGWPSSHCA
jgi:hypothetical protein